MPRIKVMWVPYKLLNDGNESWINRTFGLCQGTGKERYKSGDVIIGEKTRWIFDTKDNRSYNYLILLNEEIYSPYQIHRTRRFFFILGHEFLHTFNIHIIDRFIDILYEIPQKKLKRKYKTRRDFLFESMRKEIINAA